MAQAVQLKDASTSELSKVLGQPSSLLPLALQFAHSGRVTCSAGHLVASLLLQQSHIVVEDVNRMVAVALVFPGAC